MEAFKTLTDDYFVGNFGSVEATDQLRILCENEPGYDDDSLHDAKVGGRPEPDHSVRQCRIKGISPKRLPLISVGLQKIIKNVSHILYCDCVGDLVGPCKSWQHRKTPS